MKFEEIKTYEEAYSYAEEKGGVPKVPFMRLWQFICHNEEQLIMASKTMQEIFNLVDEECKFRIGKIEQIKENRFKVAISTGDNFEFDIGQAYYMNKLNAQHIEEKVAKAKKVAKNKDVKTEEVKTEEAEVKVKTEETKEVKVETKTKKEAETKTYTFSMFGVKILSIEVDK